MSLATNIIVSRSPRATERVTVDQRTPNFAGMYIPMAYASYHFFRFFEQDLRGRRVSEAHVSVGGHVSLGGLILYTLLTKLYSRSQR
ncbi:hypothetical protein BD626DRAFT_120271 [Schizophyllum amplum]|uniref:Uncharacterized protein n=1 Tax=Schizophyllum amplum TaxID=97359 RepID=A0A550CVC3_9AGAR|nr:hypothetical protein BD626DRAFT_120271 [Auriculariopsis ampla]